jgi:hypothetical protein
MKRSAIPRLFILGGLSLVIAAVVGERIVSMWAEKRIHDALPARGISAASIKVNLLSRTLRAYNVDWTQSRDDEADSVNPIQAEKITLRGVGIFDLLRNNSLTVKSLIIENGNLPLIARDPEKDKEAIADRVLHGLRLQKLELTNTRVIYQSDSNTTWSGLVDINVDRVALKKGADPNQVTSYEGEVTSFKILDAKLERPKKWFGVQIARVDFDHETDLLTCDSVRIVPLYSKLEHARVRGTQSTWVAAMLPRIEARGVDLKFHQDTTLTASNIRIVKGRIDAFRDRRIPLRRKSEIPLPMKWIRELDLAVEIDTIEVEAMEVVYEHFSEEAFEAGILHFSDLNALFRNVYNRAYDNNKPVTTLIASSTAMGGRIQAQFTFPLEPGVPYRAEGTISRLKLPKLNPMLENAAFVSIESGYLNELAFRFSYNNDLATGEVKIDYEGLKLKGLKKDRAGNENEIKTLVVNTALRNKNSRMGVVNNQRDKRRFIFHYWATSLMDGLRDAVMPVATDRKKN